MRWASRSKPSRVRCGWAWRRKRLLSGRSVTRSKLIARESKARMRLTAASGFGWRCGAVSPARRHAQRGADAVESQRTAKENDAISHPTPPLAEEIKLHRGHSILRFWPSVNTCRIQRKRGTRYRLSTAQGAGRLESARYGAAKTRRDLQMRDAQAASRGPVRLACAPPDCAADRAP